MRTRSFSSAYRPSSSDSRELQVREREQQALAANERLVLDLLPVFDALELAVDAFDNHEADKVREGVAYVHRALLAALELAFRAMT